MGRCIAPQPAANRVSTQKPNQHEYYTCHSGKQQGMEKDLAAGFLFASCLVNGILRCSANANHQARGIHEIKQGQDQIQGGQPVFSNAIRNKERIR